MQQYNNKLYCVWSFHKLLNQVQNKLYKYKDSFEGFIQTRFSILVV